VSACWLFVNCSAGGEQADILIGSATFDVDAVLAEQVNDSLVHDAGALHKWLDLKGGVSGNIHISLGVEEMPVEGEWFGVV
jgi:hypothetical protein